MFLNINSSNIKIKILITPPFSHFIVVIFYNTSKGGVFLRNRVYLLSIGMTLLALTGCVKDEEKIVEKSSPKVDQQQTVNDQTIEVEAYEADIQVDEIEEEESTFTLADSYQQAFLELTNQQLTLHDKTYKFINEHVESFPAIFDEAMNFVKNQSTSNYTYSVLTNSFETYTEQFLRLTGTVVQVEQDYNTASSYTHVHMQDSQGNLYVGHLLFNVTEEPIEVGDAITAYGTPVGQFESVLTSGATVKLPLFALTHIEE